MAISVPLGMSTNGSIKALLVSAISNPASPTVAELTAIGVIDLSCYLTEIETSISENTVEDVRLCTKQIFEVPGDYTATLQVTYTYNTLSTADDKARINLTSGVVKFLVVRYGVDPDIAIAAADIVDVYKFRAGHQQKNTPARNSVHTMTQKLFLSDITRNDVAVAA